MTLNLLKKLNLATVGYMSGEVETEEIHFRSAIMKMKYVI
jgi:hypothetical protein